MNKNAIYVKVQPIKLNVNNIAQVIIFIIINVLNAQMLLQIYALKVIVLIFHFNNLLRSVFHVNNISILHSASVMVTASILAIIDVLILRLLVMDTMLMYVKSAQPPTLRKSVKTAVDISITIHP